MLILFEILLYQEEKTMFVWLLWNIKINQFKGILKFVMTVKYFKSFYDLSTNSTFRDNPIHSTEHSTTNNSYLYILNN